MAAYNSSTKALVVLGLVGCGLVTLSAQVKEGPSFQADVVTYYKLPDGRVISSPGHYYRNSRGQVREESAQSGQIIDLKSHTVTLLNHETKQAVVYTMPAAGVVTNGEGSKVTANAQGPKLTPFAHGVHEGHQVTKASMVGARGEKLEVWTADDLGVVVMRRTEAANSTTTKMFRNIKVIEPDASMFEIPHGYSVTTTNLDRTAPESGRGGSGRAGGVAPSPFDRR